MILRHLVHEAGPLQIPENSPHPGFVEAVGLGDVAHARWTKVFLNENLLRITPRAPSVDALWSFESGKKRLEKTLSSPNSQESNESIPIILLGLGTASQDPFDVAQKMIFKASKLGILGLSEHGIKKKLGDATRTALQSGDHSDLSEPPLTLITNEFLRSLQSPAPQRMSAAQIGAIIGQRAKLPEEIVDLLAYFLSPMRWP